MGGGVGFYSRINFAAHGCSFSEVLHGYIKTIEDSATDSAIDAVARLRGHSAIAVVKYALGDLRGGNRLGAWNRIEARRLESDEDSQLKWIASYGYFNSTLFLGDFRFPK